MQFQKRKQDSSNIAHLALPRLLRRIYDGFVVFNDILNFK